MERTRTRQSGFLNVRGSVWLLATAIGLVCGLVLGGVGIWRVQGENAQVLRQLTELQTQLADRDAEIRDVFRKNSELSVSLEAETSSRRDLETTMEGTLDELKGRLAQAAQTEKELRQELIEAGAQARADRVVWERELASVREDSERVAQAALRDIASERDVRQELQQQLEAYQNAYENAQTEMARLAEAERNTRAVAQQEANRRLDAEEAARQEAERARQVEQAAGYAVAVETSRRVEAEQVAAVEARRRQAAQRELRRRIERETQRIDAELRPLKQKFNRDMDSFNRQSRAYAERTRQYEKSYDSEMKTIRKAYHDALARGVSQDDAKDVRKAGESAARRKYDSGISRLIAVDKPKLNQLKDEIRRTSSRIAEIEKKREKVKRGRF